MSDKFSSKSTEAPVEYSQPAKGATPFATQRRSIYFETGSANISVDSRAVVDEIGGFMKAYENTIVDVDGNTDITGARDMNLALSRQRAESVRRYLLQKYGFPPERLRTAGNGPDKPVASNDTPEGRDQNRRTDIRIYANPAAK